MKQLDFTDPRPEFDGATYDPAKDWRRLDTIMGRVFRYMRLFEPGWRTLREIQRECGGSEASISARLRDFRKEKFGGHEVLRRRRGEAKLGVWEYRLVVA